MAENTENNDAAAENNAESNVADGGDANNNEPEEKQDENEKVCVAVLKPQEYMLKIIDDMQSDFNVDTIIPKSTSEADIATCVKYCEDNNIKGVCGFNQSVAYPHVLINEALGNIVPSKLSMLYGFNKYLMRSLEEKPFWFDWCDPLNETDENIIAKVTEWPFMLKSTSLSLGRGIFKCDDKDELVAVLNDYRNDTDLQKFIADLNESFISRIDDKESIPKVLPPFVMEHCVNLTQIKMYCYEGYVSNTGEITHYSISEEVYFEDMQIIGSVIPPINISNKTHATMIEKYAATYIGKFIELGYKNQFFNLEIWIDDSDGAIYLVEINPRSAHSYHYNYLSAYNNKLFHDNMQLVLGNYEYLDNNVKGNTPFTKWKNAETHDKYAMVVLIATKKYGKFSDILNMDYIKELEDSGVKTRYIYQPDYELQKSEVTATGVTLLQLWITGNSRNEIIRNEKKVREKIYKEKYEAPYPDYWNEKDEE